MKYLGLYKKWAKTGKLEDSPHDARGQGGLCNTVIGREALEIFEPDNEYMVRYTVDTVYWGHGHNNKSFIELKELAYDFTPLRQTIVLLLAAMNDEL